MRLPLDGSSLVPQLAGAPGRDEVIGEYLAEGAIAPLVMIKRGRYKFVHSPADPDQLYDLLDDPEELRNLAAVDAHAGRAAGIPRRDAARWDLPALHARSDRQPATPPSRLPRRCETGATPRGTFNRGAMPAAPMCATIKISATETMARFPRHQR
jgi:choline-sulfatase